MKKILIVEDDPLLNNTLAYNLNEMDREIVSAFTIEEAENHLAESTFDLAILDVNLPDGSGLDLCKQIKYMSDTPVIFLTVNDLESDMIRGYEVGADDYVTKLLPISVFRKKVTALLDMLSKKAGTDIYDNGNLHIDYSSLRASIEGQNIVFTPMEFRTLKVFTDKQGKLLTRQTLIDKLWDEDEKYVDEHTLTSIISRIRGKIENHGYQYIKTVYGMGYMWLGERDDL